MIETCVDHDLDKAASALANMKSVEPWQDIIMPQPMDSPKSNMWVKYGQISLLPLPGLRRGQWDIDVTFDSSCFSTSMVQAMVPFEAGLDSAATSSIVQPRSSQCPSSHPPCSAIGGWSDVCNTSGPQTIRTIRLVLLANPRCSKMAVIKCPEKAHRFATIMQQSQPTKPRYCIAGFRHTNLSILTFYLIGPKS